MLQKCSILKTAGIFFNEPTKEHYLMEISRKARLAHTSVKKTSKRTKKFINHKRNHRKKRQ